MLYLSGAWVADAPPGIGWMATARQRDPLRKALASHVWAADNDCFGQGDRFDLAAYLCWLERMAPARGSCLFATAPDVVHQTPAGPVGDAAATLERSLLVLPELRARGYRAALVLQDGQQDVGVPWDLVDAVFTGGSTGWKLSRHAYRVVDDAKQRGKWAHMGRVNSRRRFLAAVSGGYDSCDGTLIKFGPRIRLPEAAGWTREAGAQGRLIMGGDAA